MVFLSCKEYKAFKKELLFPVTINDSNVTHLTSQSIFLSAVSHTFIYWYAITIRLTRPFFTKMYRLPRFSLLLVS